MKKTNKFFLALAMVMLIVAMIIPAWSYFTTYAQARGGYQVHLKEDSRIKEGDVVNWTKPITISSTETSEPIYVRVKAFCGDDKKLVYSADEGWTDGNDGYWYYDAVLEPGQTTENILNINIQGAKDPEDATPDDSFHVVVIYESTPARYRADGTPYANWKEILNQVVEEGGN